MKEIEQRSKNSLYIPCNCGYNHFIEFDYFTDKDNWDNKTAEKTKKQITWKHYYISFIDSENWNFFNKLKICFNYLFRHNAKICYHDIGITTKDMNKIIKHFERYKQT